MKTCATVIVLLAVLCNSAAAQDARNVMTVRTSIVEPGPAASFAVEALGGMVGSALGFGAVVAFGDADCGDDITCSLRTAGTAILASTVGAAAGTWAAGRLFETEPSGWGAVIGTVGGAFAAIGVTHLVVEEMGTSMGTGGHIVLFSVTQGMVTAFGSRIGASLR